MKIKINSVSNTYVREQFSAIPIGTCFVWDVYGASEPSKCGGAVGLKVSATEWFRFDDAVVRDGGNMGASAVFLLIPNEISFNPVMK